MANKLKQILSNISRSKGNQTMKLGQVTEYKQRNIVLQTSCRKRGGESSSRLLFFVNMYVTIVY